MTSSPRKPGIIQSQQLECCIVADGSGPATTAEQTANQGAKHVAQQIAKQVIVMRKDLGMRKGKMIAQGAHASLKVLLDAGAIDPGGDPARGDPARGDPARGDPAGSRFTLRLDPALAAWLGGRFTKICVSVDSEAELDAVVDRARAAGVPCALVVDAGHDRVSRRADQDVLRGRPGVGRRGRRDHRRAAAAVSQSAAARRTSAAGAPTSIATGAPVRVSSARCAK